MHRNRLLTIAARCALAAALLLPAMAREAKLVRYPAYHAGRVAFTYLADIWIADESGKNVTRLTAHPARDAWPRFSPDGKWVAFSSDRKGNLDVYVIPAAGGTPRQLTFHSADDNVLGWTPDGKAVLFSSMRGDDFLAKLWLVDAETGAERPAGTDYGLAASFSPDGKRIAYNQRGQVYWRKYYRGSYQTDVFVLDLATRKWANLTQFDGMDSWPMWGRDGFIYFVSDRDGGGLTNIWRVPEKGGKAEKVTQFTSGDVRWPAISADGKAIVFEHDFGIWKLDVASRKAAPIRLDIEAETQLNPEEVRTFQSRADEFHVQPNGRRVVFSVYGELFTAPVEEGELVQLTEGAARDREPQWSPDGKQIAYVSDQSGREEVWVVPADGGAAQKVTDLDTLKMEIRWSPDSKDILFTTSDNRLFRHTVGGQKIQLAASKYGNISSPVMSPDGKWVAFAMADEARQTDIWLVPAAGGAEPRKVTFDSYPDRLPRFSSDGRKLYFIRMESTGIGGFGGVADLAGSQLWVVHLEKLEKDPNAPEEPADEAEGPAAAMRRAQQQNQPPKEIQIDWGGLERRTSQITRVAGGVRTYEVVPGGRTLVFVTTEGTGMRGTPVVYTIQDNGRRQTRVLAGSAPAGGEGQDGPPTPGMGMFGGGISQLAVTRNGRTLFFKEGEGIYSVNLPAPAAGAGGGAGGGFAGMAAAMQQAASGAQAGGGAGAARRRINFTARVRIDHQRQWQQMFDDAWRTMKYRFYDPKMHGYDWDAMRAKYQPLVEFVGDRQELLNIINEMIGELNASHTGAAPPPGGREGAVQTQHPGIEFVPDEAAGRYRVAHVYKNGPADKDWVKVKAGDYLLAVDGKPVTVKDNLWKFMHNQRLNRKMTLKLNDKPSEDGAWEAQVEPVSAMQYAALRYEKWVQDRRDMVDKLSGGKAGYLHIRAMDQTSLRKFEKELREFRNKPALIIDQRFNGGGNIEQQLLAILVQREYQVWQPRGTEPTERPFAGYFGKKIVLQNWRSASNAEMFPAGFRALGLGKTLGTQTMGAVIGTGSYSLIDGSTVRTPGVGVFLADAKRTNMENLGVKPDIEVENTPEDNLNGKDRQLEAAVAELLKELGAR
jgi:tricorn protease